MQSEVSMEQEATNPPLTKKQKVVKEIKSIILIVFCVLLFRSMFFEPFKIPSGSMIPTLMIGDFILVNKFAYGLKLPFSDMFGDPVYISAITKPERGDVIVFKYPLNPDINYIKRVVGLPGDTLEIKDKIVYINGEALAAKEVKGNKFMEDMDDKFKQYNLSFYQSQTGDHKHIYQVDEDNYFNKDFPPITVPEGKYFVMGDNRDFSADSRYWKFVPFENIKGEAILVWFSMIMPWNKQSFKFRPWRIGTMID